MRIFRNKLVLIVGILLVIGGSVGSVIYWTRVRGHDDPFLAVKGSVTFPLYKSTSKTYTLVKDTVKSQAGIVFSNYSFEKGTISVSQQPKPSTEPLDNTTPTDKFATPNGDARLFPTTNKDPFIIVETPLTWVIVSTNDTSVSSTDLKEFVLKLKEIEQP